MTEEQKSEIALLRNRGVGYGKIAIELGVSENTIKSYCRRNRNVIKMRQGEHICPMCGKLVTQNPGRREKKFCSDACRRKWWNSHTGLMKENAVCAHCGKPFHGRAGRKYCCHACYIADRFGDGHVS